MKVFAQTQGQVPVSSPFHRKCVKQVPVPVSGLERDVGLARPVGVHRHTANGRR